MKKRQTKLNVDQQQTECETVGSFTMYRDKNGKKYCVSNSQHPAMKKVIDLFLKEQN